MRIAFAGESLIDFTCTSGLSFEGHEGGALTNSAIAAARLGQPTGFITQLSTDLFGERLWRHLESNGVDMRFVLRSEASSTLAFVERLATTNRYAFYTHGTADTLWAPTSLPALPDSCRYLHFGSISLLAEPAAGRITDLVEAQCGRRIVLFDPNVRPSLIADMAAYRARMPRWVAACDVLKFSDEDCAFLTPGLGLAEAAAHFLALGPRGPSAVIVTRGGEGATLYRKGHSPIDVAAPKVDVADTIGAGDTFAAGLSVALLEQGVEQVAQLAALPDDAWREVLRFAATAAALNCTREGCDPPGREALRVALAAS
ncbi:carbohydrate kinase family protein [Variovorax sp. PAMC 28711]|uniref:carbohydrate kinase family protein n=1 Tax=Variovorax sp. PAMC 28711 TaxID=1795631 RepID=UPI00078BA0A8|nr:carbohydrate kinase [Variovorax sp. PAMC 28711]AMM23911.1 ribokinase [Variovorax sp. PAMC 28711]